MNNDENHDAPFKDIVALGADTPIAPAHAIAAIAMNMAMKYHDIDTVQEGALYQQYKLEGRNMTPLHLDHVFETAERIELWLLGSSERIAKIVIDAVVAGDETEADELQAEADAEVT